MAKRTRKTVRAPVPAEIPATPEAAAPTAPPVSPAPTPPRRRGVLALLTRPIVGLPLLVLVGFLGGLVVGALRLAAHERVWAGERSTLEERVRGLETSLADSRAQEASYKVLVSVSRVLVHLYEGNFGLASEELGRVRDSLAGTTAVSGTDLGTRIDAVQTDLDELARRVEEASRSARDTMREIERTLTTRLFPESP